MKRFYSILLFALVAASCIQDRECPTNLPDAPKLSVDETSVTRVSMVVDGSFGKNMTDVTSYGVEISETLFETGGTYKTLIPQEVGNNGFSLGVTDLKINSTYFLRTFISNGYSKMYSSVITQQTPETSVASLSDVTVRDNHYLVAPTTLQLAEGYEWYPMNEENLNSYVEELAQFSFIRQDNSTATTSLFGIENLVFRKVD